MCLLYSSILTMLILLLKQNNKIYYDEQLINIFELRVGF